MALAEEPTLTPEDAGDAGVHLGQVVDERLARELPPGKTSAWVRKVFADWPRYRRFIIGAARRSVSGVRSSGARRCRKRSRLYRERGGF